MEKVIIVIFKDNAITVQCVGLNFRINVHQIDRFRPRKSKKRWN